LLGHIVHLGAQCIALCRHVSEARIECDGLVNLQQQIGLAATGQSSLDAIKICSQKTDINHRESGYLALLS
jgi:hypothetical protein